MSRVKSLDRFLKWFDEPLALHDRSYDSSRLRDYSENKIRNAAKKQAGKRGGDVSWITLLNANFTIFCLLFAVTSHLKC